LGTTAGDFVHCEKYVAVNLKRLNLVFSYIYNEKKIFQNLVTKIQLFSGMKKEWHTSSYFIYFNFFMLVVSSRQAVYWNGICALLGFYTMSSGSFSLMIRTTSWSRLQRLNVWPLKMGLIGCSKTLVWNYH